MTDFTKKQEKVITADVDNILVSAAAGSGKTTVLVERIVRKIISGKLSVDKILVVTFTKAAAKNMQEKISKALKKAIKENPDLSEPLKKQLNLLPNAYIQTLNSFCSRVVREKGYELAINDNSIEPNMVILGEQELQIMRKKAAQEAIDNKYLDILKNGEDKNFNNLVNYFTDGRSDDGLVDRLVSIYPKFRSLPDYIERIDDSVSKRIKADEQGTILFLEDFNARFIDLINDAYVSAKNCLDIVDGITFVGSKNNERIAIAKDTLETVLSETNLFINDIKSVDSQEKVFDRIKSLFEKISAVEAIGLGGKDVSVKEFMNVFGAVAALIIVAFGKNPTNYKHIASPFLPDSKYISYLKCGVNELLNLQKERTEVIKAFAEILKAVDVNYAKIKQRFHAMDFADQEQFALKVLYEPEVSEYYKEKFDEIYVDEYQDNSTLQDAIIQTFAKKNVFMVGDVKQSIYKFRYANPSMFIDKMNLYNGDSNDGTLYDLNNNFRSTPEILDFVNVIFEQIMSKATEIDYNDSHKLYPDPKAVKNNSLPRVVLVERTSGSGNDVETSDSDEGTSEYDIEDSNASASAKRDFKGVYSEIKRYLDLGVEKKDICILVRKKKVASHLSMLLNESGILTVCPESKPIYNDPDIATLCSLITLLGNEHRDECLLGVLLAGYRFSNFTLDEIAKISLYAKNNDLLYMNLIVKIRNYALQEKVDEEDEELLERTKNFVKVFDELKSDSVIYNIGEMIEKIYSASGIKATLREINDTEKLVVFKNWLCENYMSHGSDISSIAGSLEELKLELGDSAAIEYENQNVDAVTCMTYHKSKGLEFNTVIVTDFSSETSKSDGGPVIFDDDFGFLCNDFFDKTLVRDTSFERLMYEDIAKLAELSEEIRLMYVALTRAQKNLSIVTSYKVSNDKDMHAPKYYQVVNLKDTKLDKSFILKQGGRNDILISALYRINKSRELFDILEQRAEIEVPADSNMKRISFDGFECSVLNYNEISVIKSEIDRPEILKENCLAHIDADGNPYFDEYKYESSILAPSKTTVSEIKKEEQRLLYDKTSDSEVSEEKKENKVAINLIIPELEYFSEEVNYDSSSAKGTLIHNLLRYVDFKSVYQQISSGKDVSNVLEDEISYLSDEGVITSKMMPVIEEFKPNLEAFLKSDLFSRISSAEALGYAEFEKPIMFSTKVPRTDDNTLVQGIIDVLFYENGEAVIVDYKTDRISGSSLEEIESIVRDRHKLQLDLYAAALKAAGINVKSKIVWLIRKNLAIDV